MSNDSKQPLPADTAFAVLQTRIYAPVFFQKLANDYGIAPRPGTNDAQRLLDQASQLRTLHDCQEKAAGVALIDRAQQQLDAVCQQAGIAVPAGDDDVVKQAACEAARDPEIAHATLSLLAGAAAAAR